MARSHQVAPGTKVVRDLPVHGEKPLRVPNRLEALHTSLALTNRSMRALSPIIQSSPTMMSVALFGLNQVAWNFFISEGVNFSTDASVPEPVSGLP